MRSDQVVRKRVVVDNPALIEKIIGMCQESKGEECGQRNQYGVIVCLYHPGDPHCPECPMMGKLTDWHGERHYICKCSYGK